ncbi:sensor histidine kinase [Cohnella herbarum]|uniref:Histidine kinase n=1 Tax=Cohnella herbarum TaxID=2728023 RepID=A0A7Z2VJC3_9BACL|nr:histidine kinase [Cohnella herbarum]QJD84025.1 histidine kinase [Cohnella herbarum]
MRREFSVRHTIFMRLVVTFMLIMIPVFLLGIYIYQWAIRTTSEDISRTAESQIAFYLNDLENEIERMKLLQYGLLEDGDLNKLAITWETMGTIDRMDKINSVINRIIAIQNSSRYIRDVNVHIRPIGKTLSALLGPSEIDEDKFGIFGSEAIRQGAGTRLIDWNGELYLSAASSRWSKGKPPLFIVEIELDRQRLNEALEQFNTYPDNGSLLVFGQGGYGISSGAKAIQDGAKEIIRQLEHFAESGPDTFSLSGQRYFVSRAHSERLDMSIYRLINDRIVRKPLERFYLLAWLIAIGAFGIILIYAVSTYKFIHKPLLKLVRGFRRLENGDLELTIAHRTNDEFQYIYTRFNQMVVNLRMLIDQAYKQKILTQRAELKQLQSQINPHFLYNSFFILNTMAKTGDTERIEQFTTQLGEYFRFVTRNASDEIRLKQEIRHARMYTEIQDMRFYKRIHSSFDELPSEFEEIRVPRLIVQPIIENAFEHSLEKKARNGRIDVRFERVDRWVCIIIEDNGEGLSDEEIYRISHRLGHEDSETETTGIVNVHRRIVFTCGEGSGLEISRSGLGGLRVTIRIPLEEEKFNVQAASG